MSTQLSLGSIQSRRAGATRGAATRSDLVSADALIGRRTTQPVSWDRPGQCEQTTLDWEDPGETPFVGGRTTQNTDCVVRHLDWALRLSMQPTD